MAVWRCPHCATQQPESSRCWVCRRSTTSCVTCRHFRKAVADGLGICGLDPRRSALTGQEMRPCWVGAPQPLEPDARGARPMGGIEADGRAGSPDGRRLPRTFVPVESLVPGPTAAATAVLDATAAAGGAGPEPEAMASGVPATAPSAPEVPPGVEPGPIPGRWWLWGDPAPWPES